MSVRAQDKDPYDVMRWLKEVEARKVSRRDLVGPGPGIVMSNRKLATALVATLSGETYADGTAPPRHMGPMGGEPLRLLGGRDILSEIYK